MSTQIRPEFPIEGAQALVAHLRQHRQDIHRPAQELAQQFGLTQAFVESVLSQTDPRNRGEAQARRQPKVGLLKRIYLWLGEATGRAARKPSLFVAVSTFLGICFVFLVTLIGRIHARTTGIDSAYTPYFTGLAVFMTIGISHLVIYFRRAMVRYVFYGALVVWVEISCSLMVSVWLSQSKSHELSRMIATFSLAIITFFCSMFYALVGSFCSVTGGYLKVVVGEIKEDQMSRQEILERYFELQERLSRAVSVQQEPTWEDWPTVRVIRKHLYWSSIVLGIGVETISMLGNAIPHGDIDNAGWGILFILLLIVTLLLRLTCLACIAFLGGDLIPGFILGFLLYVGFIVADLIPIGFYGPHLWAQRSFTLNSAIGLGIFSVIGAVVGLGAKIQRSAVRETNLQQNDQATLMAEMLRIQWRLSDEAKSTCVMVVDVVRSSVMKADADPLAVEYSFREYQAFIERTAKPYNGSVHSTAGDGAVVSFPSCADALIAAKKLQSGMEGFNRDFNRLASPFRVRIGIHVGEVRGDLHQVQFAEVIDIAAHVEGLAPAGGIAATEDVVAELNENDFIPLATHVDRHSVFVALDPLEL